SIALQIRHPEVRAKRASKGDGPSRGRSSFEARAVAKSSAEVSARDARAPQYDGERFRARFEGSGPDRRELAQSGGGRPPRRLESCSIALQLLSISAAFFARDQPLSLRSTAMASVM